MVCLSQCNIYHIITIYIWLCSRILTILKKCKTSSVSLAVFPEHCSGWCSDGCFGRCSFERSSNWLSWFRSSLLSVSNKIFRHLHEISMFEHGIKTWQLPIRKQTWSFSQFSSRAPSFSFQFVSTGWKTDSCKRCVCFCRRKIIKSSFFCGQLRRIWNSLVLLKIALVECSFCLFFFFQTPKIYVWRQIRATSVHFFYKLPMQKSKWIEQRICTVFTTKN